MVEPNLSLLRLQNSSGYQSIYPPLTFKTSDFGLQLIRFLFYGASDKAVCLNSQQRYSKVNFRKQFWFQVQPISVAQVFLLQF